MNDEFEPLDPPGAASVRVRFKGRFQENDVIWHATIMTLAEAGAESSYIDIGHEAGGVRPVTIALPVCRISLPTIRKAVVMVRNYRRLTTGRHRWGGPLPQHGR